MATALVKIDIHMVFHVKSTSKTIRKEDIHRVHEYIGGIIKSLGGIPMEIGGMPDHVHVLASLPKNLSVVDFAKVIKAKSSLWIKTVDSYYSSFAWQEGYCGPAPLRGVNSITP